MTERKSWLAVRKVVPLLVAFGVANIPIVQAQKGKPTPTPVPTATPVATATPTPVPTATPTPVPAPTLVPIPTVVPSNASAPLSLTPYSDPWTPSYERWRDIAFNGSAYNQYNGWAPYTAESNGGYSTSNFKYGTHGSVTVTYDKAPNVPYFVAHIEAQGLKPNFAYQMKLVGKPVYGSASTTNASYKGRGFGPYVKRDASKGIVSVTDGHGEDWANEQFGYRGRWWNDTSQGTDTNATTDTAYQTKYPNETVYGYLFMGDFVTDSAGNASVDVIGKFSYHITWQDTQSTSLKHVRMQQHGYPGKVDSSGNTYFSITGSALPNGGYYAYGNTAPSSGASGQTGLTNVYLWYEYESGRSGSNGVVLLPGQYRCRLMITEESFHSSGMGGKWESVLATEDFAKDGFGRTLYDANGNAQPDIDPSNDIVFNIPKADGTFIAPPAAPATLSAAPSADASGNPTVALSWTASSGANSNYYYKIRRSQISGGPYEVIAGGVNTKTTSFNDAAVFGDTTYYYTIAAVNSGVEGPASAEISVTTLAAPFTLAATAGNAQVALSWTAHTGAGSYIIKRGATTGGPYATVTTVASTVTAYTDTNLINGTTYYYVVLATNSTGTNVNSNEASATPGAIPNAPTTLTATAVSLCQIDLAWTDTSDNETGFEIERAEGANGFTSLAIVGANVTYYADTNVPNNNVAYTYRVRAVQNSFASEFSNEASASTSGGSVAELAAPSNLAATAGDAKVTLNWTASGCATGYNLKRFDLDTNAYVTIATVEAAVTTYTDTGLTNGETYSYVVSAVNSAGNVESDDTAPVSATPSIVQLIKPAIAPNGGTFFGATQVTLSSSEEASIRYTTDGSDPTETSTLYTAPFVLSSSKTVKARAFKDGFLASPVADAVFTIENAATFTATADAHVRAGNFASQNFGTATTLEVKTSTSSKENRDSYVKFDLANLGTVGSIGSAKLRIYAALSASGSISTTAYVVADTDWTETGITWNTKPARGSSLGSVTVSGTTYGWYELDVTSYVQSEIAAGRRTLSLALHNGANTSPMITINSREGSANQPQLVVGG